MNTSNESLQSQQAKIVGNVYDTVSKLISQVEELSSLVVQTRDIQLGQAAHMDKLEFHAKQQAEIINGLERRIKKLESGGSNS